MQLITDYLSELLKFQVDIVICTYYRYIFREKYYVTADL